MEGGDAVDNEPLVFDELTVSDSTIAACIVGWYTYNVGFLPYGFRTRIPILSIKCDDSITWDWQGMKEVR